MLQQGGKDGTRRNKSLSIPSGMLLVYFNNAKNAHKQLSIPSGMLRQNTETRVNCSSCSFNSFWDASPYQGGPPWDIAIPSFNSFWDASLPHSMRMWTSFVILSIPSGMLHRSGSPQLDWGHILLSIPSGMLHQLMRCYTGYALYLSIPSGMLQVIA